VAIAYLSGTNPYPCPSFFPGFLTKEVAFFHKDSKSLIEADLLLNLPPKEQVGYLPSCQPSIRDLLEQYSKSNKTTFSLLTGTVNPWSYAHKRLAWSAGSDRE